MLLLLNLQANIQTHKWDTAVLLVLVVTAAALSKRQMLSGMHLPPKALEMVSVAIKDDASIVEASAVVGLAWRFSK